MLGCSGCFPVKPVRQNAPFTPSPAWWRVCLNFPTSFHVLSRLKKAKLTTTSLIVFWRRCFGCTGYQDLCQRLVHACTNKKESLFDSVESHFLSVLNSIRANLCNRISMRRTLRMASFQFCQHRKCLLQIIWFFWLSQGETPQTI